MDNQQPIIRKKTYHSDPNIDDKQKPFANRNSVDKLLTNLSKITLLDILDEFAKESENKNITDILKSLLGNVQDKPQENDSTQQWNQGKQDRPYNKFNQKNESNQNNFQNNKFQKRNTDFQGGKSSWNDNQRGEFGNKENRYERNNDRGNYGNDRNRGNYQNRGENRGGNRDWKNNNAQEGGKGDWNAPTNNDWNVKSVGEGTNKTNDWKPNNNSSWVGGETTEQPPLLSWGSPQHK